jgi:hypothetical protein
VGFVLSFLNTNTRKNFKLLKEKKQLLKTKNKIKTKQVKELK